MDMEEKITMADIVIRIIRENQLTPGEENRIRELLEERKQQRDEKRGCRCLAEYIEMETSIMLACGEKQKQEKCSRLIKLCFTESRIGSMDIKELSAGDIRKLIILMAEMQGMDRGDRMSVIILLQHTLDELGGKGILNFNPSKRIYSECKAAMDRTTFIENPYTPEEMCRITEWIDAHPHDMRGLAVGMWLASDISADEIVELRKKDLMDSDGINAMNPTVVKKNEAEDYIALSGRREEIIRNALNLHAGRNLEYIFMPESEEGTWKKMQGRSLPLKMSFICRDIGIQYRPFKCTEAIKWCER